MARKILLVTTDQQRFDTLGCNGGALARTPVVDALAAEGVRFTRAHPQSVVCMPSRSTILTGQHPSTHGVWMNGVPLPIDAPSVAEVLGQAGYRTALVGKAHFEPMLDPFLRFEENALSRTGTEPPTGRHRGFEHLELATHGAIGPLHYSQWLAREHPEAVADYYPALDGSLQVNAAGGGDTGAPRSRSIPSTAAFTTPTGWPTAPWPGWTPWPPRTTGSAG
jgi:arylsulfatase A-like enzyme